MQGYNCVMDQTSEPMPIAPPTTPGALGRKRREETWHRAIGIILIVVGSCGVLWNGAQVISALASLSIPTTGGAIDAVHDVQRRYAGVMSASHGASMVAACFLLVAGILLLVRKRIARIMLLHWAWVKLVLATLIALLTYSSAHEMMNAVVASGPGMATPASINDAFALAQAAFVLVIGSIMPIFVLFYFFPAKVRRRMEDWN